MRALTGIAIKAVISLLACWCRRWQRASVEDTAPAQHSNRVQRSNKVSGGIHADPAASAHASIWGLYPLACRHRSAHCARLEQTVLPALCRAPDPDIWKSGAAGDARPAADQARDLAQLSDLRAPAFSARRDPAGNAPVLLRG